MVLFSGKSKRFESLINLAILVCVVGPLTAFAITEVRKFRAASPSVSIQEFLVSEYPRRGLPVLAVLAPILILLLIARSRVRREYASAFATDQGLHFPFFPGGEFGRIIPWQCLVRVESALPEDPRITRFSKGCVTLILEQPLYMIIFLNCERSRAWLGNRILKAVYEANDVSAVSPQDGAERMIIEFIQVTGCSHRTVVRTINSLIRNRRLIEQYCNNPSKFVVVDRPDGSTVLLDMATGAVIDSAGTESESAA